MPANILHLPHFSSCNALLDAHLEELQKRFGMTTWMITRLVGDELVILRLKDRHYRLHRGYRLNWRQNYCGEVVEKGRPAIFPDASAHPDHASLSRNNPLNIRAYVGLPLVDSDNRKFGTLCAIDPQPQSDSLQDAATSLIHEAALISFLLSNALYWLEEFHADGLRVDAVASMLYRDYSRSPGEWVPNKDGGRENYEAIAVLQRMNTATYGDNPGIMTVAEESTAYPGVSQPVDQGGLGFGFKWNMGWMNDTLEYIKKDPIHRSYHHHQMTFGLVYAFSENFILPISHDEVVHGKGSMFGKMPGNEWEKFANLRSYYGFMWGHPGKKLLFMGQELAQRSEWNHDAQVDWECLSDPNHAGIQRLVRDLNHLYRDTPALHAKDCFEDGFQWINGGDSQNSVFSWVRRGGPDDPEVVVVCNFTPQEHGAYRLGMPAAGTWREALNSDAEIYGGSNRGNYGSVEASDGEYHGQPAHADVTIPPLSAIYLVRDT